ncbi:MAG: DUF5668 domain-containing protein [Tissierellaceae bacterium]|nr:DUF5668 domain-containing protein [Tissierellaceae bacterium]
MKGKFFWGIALILIGIGFLMEQFYAISFSQVFKMYWPSILILIGIINFLDRKSSRFGNIVLILIGVVLQVDKLNLLGGINIFKLIWPIVLILLGLKIIFSKDIFMEFNSHFHWKK